VLEHLHEYNDAVKEIHRVLKPGGKFYASVPATWPEKICWKLSKEYQNIENKTTLFSSFPFSN
jgi:predicted SAM-dependent methyltransferase